MNSRRRTLIRLYWIATMASFAGALTLLGVYTPIEREMGLVQKIFYVHLPVAFNGFGAAFVVFAAGVGYLWQREAWWDDLAAAAGKVTALCCAVVLLTGMIWAHSAWGKWWTWSPRLTFSLILLLLYWVYPLVRMAIESPQRRAVVSAVYGIVAFLDVPLVYLSVKLMPDIHPSSIALEPAMSLTLAAWFVPVTMLVGGMIAAGATVERLSRGRQELARPERAARGVVVGRPGGVG